MLNVADLGPVRTLTLSRPERKNAVPPDGWGRLRAEFEAFDRSDQRVLVVTGAGGEFCSGADLSMDPDDLAQLQSVAGRHDRMRAVEGAALALHRISKPTIAAVDGIAAGAGVSLALGCDVVVATTRAQFAVLFVRRGLVVDFGGTWLLPRLVGLQRAKELALSGRRVPADEAHRLGMVTRVVESAELGTVSHEMAQSFLRGGPRAQSLIKAGLDGAAGMSFEEALAYETYAQLLCLGSEEAAEGISAFLEKREPEFKGR